MQINRLVIDEAHWRELPSEFRQDLRRILKRKSAIVGHQVLDVARDLCRHQAHGLALDLYRAIAGDPEPPYECGLGAMVTLRCHYMGEAMKNWLYGSEETPLLLPTQHLPRTPGAGELPC